MKKEPKKKMTIEDLAIVVSRGFDNVEEKFKEVHKKMDKGFSATRKETEDLAIMVGRGFADVDLRFDKVESRLDKVETKMEQVDIRLMSVEDNQLDLKLRMDVLSQNNKGNDELRGRVVVLEKKVGVKER
ncbi:MAG: hypothetical protein AAB874_06660 [Patescibacteria group bacterium]